jgi:hypothetical protein
LACDSLRAAAPDPLVGAPELAAAMGPINRRRIAPRKPQDGSNPSPGCLRPGRHALER